MVLLWEKTASALTQNAVFHFSSLSSWQIGQVSYNLLNWAQSGKTQGENTPLSSYPALFTVHMTQQQQVPSPRPMTAWKALLWVEVHWHVCVGGCIRKSDSMLWSVQPHLFSTAAPSLSIKEQTCWDVCFFSGCMLFQLQFRQKCIKQLSKWSTKENLAACPSCSSM